MKEYKEACNGNVYMRFEEGLPSFITQRQKMILTISPITPGTYELPLDFFDRQGNHFQKTLSIYVKYR
jgi:hypothetical protein